MLINLLYIYVMHSDSFLVPVIYQCSNTITLAMTQRHPHRFSALSLTQLRAVLKAVYETDPISLKMGQMLFEI